MKKLLFVTFFIFMPLSIVAEDEKTSLLRTKSQQVSTAKVEHVEVPMKQKVRFVLFGPNEAETKAMFAQCPIQTSFHAVAWLAHLIYSMHRIAQSYEIGVGRFVLDLVWTIAASKGIDIAGTTFIYRQIKYPNQIIDNSNSHNTHSETK